MESERKSFFNSDKTLQATQKILQGLDLFIILLSLVGFLTVLYEAGFEENIFLKIKLHTFYSFCIFTFCVVFFLKIILQTIRKVKGSRLISEYILLGILLLMVLVRLTSIEHQEAPFLSLLNEHFFINLVFLIIFIIEIS